jgi:hypothetical protein
VWAKSLTPDVVSILREYGHDIGYEQTDQDPYWLRDMFAYFEAHTYLGSDSERNFELARTIAIQPMTDFRTWSVANMRVGS